MAALAAALLALVWWQSAVLAPFCLSFALAFVLQPLVAALARKGCPRVLAVLLCLGLSAALAAALLVLLVPIVSELVPQLRAQLPQQLLALRADLQMQLLHWGLNESQMAQHVQLQLTQIIQSHASQWLSDAGASLWAGGGDLLSALAWVILMPMLAFYWLADWDAVMARGLALVPLAWQDGVRDLGAQVNRMLGQYLRGQLLVMLVLALYYGLGLSLFGFGLAWPIGVFTGLAVCIPYLGFVTGLLLAFVAGWLQFHAPGQGGGHLWWALAVVYGGGQVFESMFLTPRLVGARIGLHPLAVILALLVFGQIWGFWGVVLALPSTACLALLVQQGLRGYRRSHLYLEP